MPAQQRYCHRQGCSHRECRLAWNRSTREIKLRMEEGRSNKVPLELAQKVIEQQRRRSGITTTKGLARALNVDYRVIDGIESGTLKFVQRATFEKIRRPLGAQPETVSSVATTLRLQMLQAEGWTINDLAAGLGSSSALFTRYDVVHYETAVRVIDFVLAAGPGTSELGRRRSLARGCRPRADYDQDLLADPLWDGKGGLLDHGGLSPEEAESEYLFLRSHGVPSRDAAERVGRSADWGWRVDTRTQEAA